MADDAGSAPLPEYGEAPLGKLSAVVMLRVRCPHCGQLQEHDNQILFTVDEYEDIPRVWRCDTPECGKPVGKPAPGVHVVESHFG